MKSDFNKVMVPPPPREDSARKIVCECLQVDEAQVLSALGERGASSIMGLTRCTGAGGGCTSCHPALKAYLDAFAS